MQNDHSKVTARLAGVLMLAIAASAIALPDAGAQKAPPEPPSPEKGAALASRLCSGCHLMEGSHNRVVPAGILSLRGIANRSGQTGQRILDTLILPHPPMPDMRLTIHEILDIVAYLETLRTNEAVPKLITPVPAGVKPMYPEPS